MEIRRLPRDSTITQKASLEKSRQKLMAGIAKFHEAADAMVGGDEVNEGTVHVDDLRFCAADFLEEEELEYSSFEGDLEEIQPEVPAERIGIWMPSSVPGTNVISPRLASLRAEELELRMGQANDCLEKLRQALGLKAIIYRQHFRSADSTWSGTRSKQEVLRCQIKIEKSVRSYQRARSAMQRLGIDQDILRKSYQEILPDQLSVNKEVTEENRFGQGSDSLAWFWRLNASSDGQLGTWMDECEFLKLQSH